MKYKVLSNQNVTVLTCGADIRDAKRKGKFYRKS